MMFNDKDIQQIEEKQLTVDNVLQQITIFKNGIQHVTLKDVATIDNGILKLSEACIDKYITVFNTEKSHYNLLKFVPASGAATRMFKFLFKFIEDYNPKNETINAYINRNKANDISMFFVGLEKFPFYETVLEATKSRLPDFNTLKLDQRRLEFIKTMLSEKHLNFSFYPKGLLAFHSYKDHNSTAFEEHLFEAALYAATNGKAALHFTISERHKTIFDDEFKRIEDVVERKTNTCFNIDFSYQCQSTDTIAVTPDNEPFRNTDGSLLFRPSGHGALINNLNTIDADIIFVKNIDNVVVSKYEQDVTRYKKVLAGILIELQQQAFTYLNALDQLEISESLLITIAEFLTRKLNVVISLEFEKYSKKYQIEYLKEKLNRPIRVCGMVKNEGEPGGGPFWVKHENGQVSLQIVESAQINKKNKQQKEILKQATHFNPVDLVCGVKNYKGEKFNLLDFVDPKAAFISSKTKSGKDLKALELPGLWNGAMANWNSIFVEVPLITFNPVKTVNDLLKSPHQLS